MAFALDARAAQPVLVDLLFELRALAGETHAVDLGAADGDSALVAALAGRLGALLDRGLELIAALQRADEADDELPDLEAVDPDAWLAPPAPRAARIGDVCFAGALELRRIARELATADGDDARLVAADTARRKLRRAIRAVLETARETGVYDVLGGDHQGHHQVADLASGLATRRLYAGFRRALRRADAATPDAVLAAVRYCGGAMATLVAAPDYADVRASDRAVLRGLRERALRWARHDRGVESGLQLLDDVWTCSDLMRDINRRQELRAHDSAIVDACSGGPGEPVAVDAWLAKLDALRGLDDRLDELVALARAATGDGERAAHVAELRGQLERIRR